MTPFRGVGRVASTANRDGLPCARSTTDQSNKLFSAVRSGSVTDVWRCSERHRAPRRQPDALYERTGARADEADVASCEAGGTVTCSAVTYAGVSTFFADRDGFWSF